MGTIKQSVIAFLGAGCEKYARFSSALIASAKPESNVLVWDASTCKSLFIGTVGDSTDEKIYFRSIVYTANANYARSHAREYDVIIVVDDFATERSSFHEYGDMVDYVYLCMSANRYALEIMLRAAASMVGKNLPLSYIFCGTPQDVERWRVRSYWKYLQGKEQTNRDVFYIPVCENDFQAMLKLEYGMFRMKDLSDGLHMLFYDLSVKLNIDSTVIRGIEQTTLFYT